MEITKHDRDVLDAWIRSKSADYLAEVNPTGKSFKKRYNAAIEHIADALMQSGVIHANTFRKWYRQFFNVTYRTAKRMQDHIILKEVFDYDALTESFHLPEKLKRNLDNPPDYAEVPLTEFKKEEMVS